ncbi:MAG: hypothetical protein KDC80_10160 [Saprospiraceae bacterium]|nr:hypothetical protein [Saprospiraceae bacterium]
MLTNRILPTVVSIILFITFCQGFTGSVTPELTDEITISIWYGHHQRFGTPAFTQRWINILGNISPVERVIQSRYTLNGQSPIPFSLGSDLHRLAEPGDFNLDIRLNDLNKGRNQLVIMVQNDSGKEFFDTVLVEIEERKSWPLPYDIDFANVADLQDVTQIVDGKWIKTADGIRTDFPYYDRVISIGDTSWTSYDVLIKLTIHDWSPSQPGPPTYNVSHFGVAMHWRGHHPDKNQPYRKWYPLGAQGEFLLKEENDSCRWRILFDGQHKEKPPVYASGVNKIVKGLQIWIRSQIRNLGGDKSVYSFKQWAQGEDEPAAWNISEEEVNDYPSGSLCLVPHNSDVTIHSIKITPVEP